MFCVLFTVYLNITVKEKQFDAQLILSIFRHLNVSGVSMPIIRWYNRMHATVGTYYYF